MFNWIIEKARTQGADRDKAHKYLLEMEDAKFRDLMQGHDDFVPYMEKVKDPSILIGTATDSFGQGVPVRIETDKIPANWIVQGGVGTGKTTFVTSVLARAMEHDYPIGVVDCKEGFFDAALRWTAALAYRMEPARREQFIRTLAVINPFSDALVPLNVCKVVPGSTPEIQAYNVCLSLSRLYSSDMSFHMENILRHLLLLLTESGLTLVEAPLVMQDDNLRNILVLRSTYRPVKDFFLSAYDNLPPSSKTSLLTRIQNLLLAENIKLMLGADDLIDLKTILDRGHPLFMFLGKGPDAPEEQVDLMASLILQLLFQAALSTVSDKRRPYQIIMDEFFHLLEAPALEKRFNTALTTFRSFGVMFSLVMHNFSQVPGGLRENIINHCYYMAIFRTSSRNAQNFGDFLPEHDAAYLKQVLRKTGRPPSKHEVRAHLIENLERLPDRHCYWYDKRKPYRALLLRVPDISTPEESAGISKNELEDFMKSEGILLGGYAQPKEELRRQIEARRKRLEEMTRLPPVHFSSEPEHIDAPAGANAGPGEKNSRGKKKKPGLG